MTGCSSPANLDLAGGSEVLDRAMTCGMLDPVALGKGAYIALDYLRPDNESAGCHFHIIVSVGTTTTGPTNEGSWIPTSVGQRPEPLEPA